METVYPMAKKIVMETAGSLVMNRIPLTSIAMPMVLRMESKIMVILIAMDFPILTSKKLSEVEIVCGLPQLMILIVIRFPMHAMMILIMTVALTKKRGRMIRMRMAFRTFLILKLSHAPRRPREQETLEVAEEEAILLLQITNT